MAVVSRTDSRRHAMAELENGVAELAIPFPGAFAAFLTQCEIARLSDRRRWKIQRLGALRLVVSEQDMRDGATRLELLSNAPAAIDITGPQQPRKALRNARVFLENSGQSEEFVTDDSGELIVFEDLDRFRIVVPDYPSAKVAIRKL